MTNFSGFGGGAGGFGQQGFGQQGFGGQPGFGDVRLDAANQAWNNIGSFETYEGAQAAVDQLSDAGFPVEHLDIIGSDLRLVERVTGRLTNGRATAAGAASGAWFGLFIALLLGLFTTSGWLGLIITGLVIGALWGAVFGYLGHAATRGRRDFSSMRTLAATRYDVIARDGMAEQARSMLAQPPAQPLR